MVTTQPCPRASRHRFLPGGGAAAVVVLLAILFASLSCASERYAKPRGVERAVRFIPPASYHQWWDELQDCSGLKGSFYAVQWWMVPGTHVRDDIVGLTDITHRTVYLPARSVWARGIVDHEALHILTGDVGHPVPPFGTCAPMYAAFP